jgi:hypothetical protein
MLQGDLENRLCLLASPRIRTLCFIVFPALDTAHQGADLGRRVASDKIILNRQVEDTSNDRESVRDRSRSKSGFSFDPDELEHILFHNLTEVATAEEWCEMVLDKAATRDLVAVLERRSVEPMPCPQLVREGEGGRRFTVVGLRDRNPMLPRVQRRVDPSRSLFGLALVSLSVT